MRPISGDCHEFGDEIVSDRLRGAEEGRRDTENTGVFQALPPLARRRK